MDEVIHVGNYAVNIYNMSVSKVGEFGNLHEACHNGKHWQLVGNVLIDVSKSPDYTFRLRHPSTMPEDTGPYALAVKFGATILFEKGSGLPLDFNDPDFKKIWPTGFKNLLGVIAALEVELETNSYSLRFWKWILNSTDLRPKEVR